MDYLLGSMNQLIIKSPKSSGDLDVEDHLVDKDRSITSPATAEDSALQPRVVLSCLHFILWQRHGLIMGYEWRYIMINSCW